jgi:hypothetical protein
MTFEPSRSGRIQPRSEREKKINSLRDAVDFQGVLQMKRFPFQCLHHCSAFCEKNANHNTFGIILCSASPLSCHVMSFFCLRMFLFSFRPCPPPSSRPRRRCPASRFVTRRTDKETRCRSRHIWAQGDGLRGADVFTCLLSCFFFPVELGAEVSFPFFCFLVLLEVLSDKETRRR